ncbi:hypothetical protein Y032_0160g3351 [Ancylostoma ceylanicum]|uniref:HAT C-terminal dimerisation domain-containing protein n=1 Tax=Ancylostoma ceylanicum TaxID=53326 RepID=A0A016SXE8_9BILA|nr:hypothetical protein Y032_0160g3351 [Ancylostoma ceylanicum]
MSSSTLYRWKKKGKTASVVAEKIRECLEPLKIVKRVAAKLNRSGKLRSLFKRFLKEESLQIILPMTDSPTRWSSTYYMICDFLNTLPAVEKLLLHLRLSPLEDNEIRLLKAIRVFLEPYQTMTKQVCYQSACISIYIPVGKALITTTEGNLENARKEAVDFGECLLLNTNKYFEEWFESRVLQFATMCDARFAFLDTVFSKEKWSEIMDDFISCRLREVDDIDVSVVEAGLPPSTVESSPVWGVLTGKVPNKETDGTTNKFEDELKLELQKYAVCLKRHESRPLPEEDPFVWWRAHRGEFPNIAAAAAHYLVAPPTSVDCERLFSSAGIIYSNKRRGRLSGKNARLLLMINANSNRSSIRSSRGWSPSEIRGYGRSCEMDEIYSSSEDENSSEGDSSDSEELDLLLDEMQ